MWDIVCLMEIYAFMIHVLKIQMGTDWEMEWEYISHLRMTISNNNDNANNNNSNNNDNNNIMTMTMTITNNNYQ